MKQLAAAADARWEAKPRLVEYPSEPVRLVSSKTPAEAGSAADSATEEAGAARHDKEPVVDPWAQHKSGGPGEKWQPAAWNPTKPKAP